MGSSASNLERNRNIRKMCTLRIIIRSIKTITGLFNLNIGLDIRLSCSIIVSGYSCRTSDNEWLSLLGSG